jgi:hypothetical protein
MGSPRLVVNVSNWRNSTEDGWSLPAFSGDGAMPNFTAKQENQEKQFST